MDIQLEPYAADAVPVLEQAGAYSRWGKRCLDVALVLLSAPLVVPVIAIAAALMALEGGQPFFWQARVGRGGQAFPMLKLRSMRRDAERYLQEIINTCPASAAEWERSQKLRRDPRITPLGMILRKTSIDELPQLWNVLVGHMSLVGPRPMMVSQSPLYPGSAYYRMRPGLTGPWQVFARNHRRFGARATYDSFYEEKRGLAYDVLVMCQTVRAVMRGTGQ